MYLLDSHCDTPTQIVRGRDLTIDNPKAHVDFPKIKRGGVDAAFFALYIPAGLTGEEAFDCAKLQLDSVKGMLDSNPDKARLTLTCEQAHKNKEDGRFSVFLGLENGSPIGRSLQSLHWFYEEGVRYMTLCHSDNNEICDSCASTSPRWNGLSPFGREVIAEMNKLGMLIDVSHISDKSFWDVLNSSSKPVVATHSCCRTLCNHPRNMTDEMIRAMADKGGVIQINFYPVFLDSQFKEEEMFTMQRPSYKMIADHIDHAVSVAGIDHVGIGSDFDGIDVTPEGMEDISMIHKLFEELRHRGYSEYDLKKIASENFFNAFSVSDSIQ